MVHPSTLRRRQARGEQRLDDLAEKGLVPKDWPDLIDLDRLNMAGGLTCVLGQLAPRVLEDHAHEWDDYDEVVRHLTRTEDFDVRRLGFFTSRSEFPRLTAIWRRRIARRQTGHTDRTEDG